MRVFPSHTQETLLGKDVNASITARAWVGGAADLLDPSFVTNRGG